MNHIKTRSRSTQESHFTVRELATGENEEYNPELWTDDQLNDPQSVECEETTKQKIGQVCQSLYEIPLRAYIVIFHLMMEKLSFLGISALLPIYLNTGLGFTEKGSRTAYHCFSALCYLIPIAGAVMADNGLGRFKTIFLFSLISLVGNLIVPLTVLLSNNAYVFLVAIFILAIGSGGVKACLSAFAADQLCVKQESGEFTNPSDQNTAVFFGVIYFAVNLGGFVGQVVMPSLRSQTHSPVGNGTLVLNESTPKFGYTLAFGVAGLIYLTSLPIFLMGHKVFIQKIPQGAPLTACFKCIVYALKQHMKHQTVVTNERPKKIVTFTIDSPTISPTQSSAVHNRSFAKLPFRSTEHHPNSFWNSAEIKFSPQFIHELRQTFRVASLFVPIPIFWALYEQQGSTWIFQANKMDGSIWNGWSIKPEQMLTLNVLSCLMTIPIMNFIIYPWLSNHGLLDKMTSRIIVGYFMAALSFLCSGFVQLSIDHKMYGNLPKSATDSNLVIHNRMDDLCSLRIQVRRSGNSLIEGVISRNELFRKDHMEHSRTQIQVQPNPECPTLSTRSSDFKSDIYAGKESHIVIYQTFNDQTSLAKMNYDQISISADDVDPKYCAIKLGNLSQQPQHPVGLLNIEKTDSTMIYLQQTEFSKIIPGRYKVYHGYDELNPKHLQTGELKLSAASVVYLQLHNKSTNISTSSRQIVWDHVVLHQGKHVHMAAQIPQIFLMTFAEILICISAISFAYSEAPPNMKTIMQAVNQFTVFVGNILVILCTIPSHHSLRQSWEMFAFTILSVLCGGLMFLLVRRYETHTVRFEDTEHLPEPESPGSIIKPCQIPPRTSFSYPNFSTIKKRTDFDMKKKRNYTSLGLTTAMIQYRNILQRSRTTSLSLWSPQMTSGEPDMGGFIEWGEQIKSSYSLNFK